MKKATLFFASLFIAGLINAQTSDAAKAATAAPVTEQAKPDIATVLQFNEENHDFGEIPYGKPVQFDVVIKNISKDSVKVDNVKVGCGCTTPSYDHDKKYGPGESFKVTLGYNGYADGPFEKYADIFFSNGASKQIRFHGKGYKVPETPAPTNGAVQKLKSAGK